VKKRFAKTTSLLLGFLILGQSKVSLYYSLCLVWIKNNKTIAIAFSILCIIAIVFNALGRPHTNEYKAGGDSQIFFYVMSLLSIVLALSISEILTNSNISLRFIVANFLIGNKKKKRETKKDKYTKFIHYLYICLLMFLLSFPIQYWYASYQVFHAKTDWSFFHVILHMIAPIMFFAMSKIVFSFQDITRESYFNSKKIAAYFMIMITIVNIIVDYITLHQSTIFTETNGLRTIFLPLMLFLGVVRPPRRLMLTDIFSYIIAISTLAVFTVLN